MIVIVGMRQRSTIISKGEFNCPFEGGSRRYAHKQVSQWFTFFFIPIFKVGGGEDYVECQSCGTHYPSNVL